MISVDETYIDLIYLREYLPGEYLFPENLAKKAAILFLHGYPGSQKNYDIAEHLTFQGFHCYVMHYRGSWKSKGDYSLLSIYEDVESIIHFLHQKGFENKAISLIGSSWGGFVALEILAKYPDLCKVILLAPFINIGAHESDLSDVSDFLAAVTRPAIKNYEKEKLFSDLKAVQKEFNPWHKLKEIEGKKVLIVHGAVDQLCPIEYSRQLKFQFKTEARLYELQNQDHFLYTREILYEFCLTFLTEP